MERALKKRRFEEREELEKSGKIAVKNKKFKKEGEKKKKKGEKRRKKKKC